jgi:hypothetical protein
MLMTEIFEFIKSKHQEKRRPVPLSEINAYFGSYSYFRILEAVQSLYNEGKLQEVSIQHHLPFVHENQRYPSHDPESAFEHNYQRFLNCLQEKGKKK